MDKTVCSICLTDIHDREVYKANFTLADINSEVFSARRIPDKVHYRIVECRQCGLWRGNPVLSEELLSALYAQSKFHYHQESVDAAKTYLMYFSRYMRNDLSKMSVLEVGCGDGSFLALLKDRGCSFIHGVEPSHDACSNARNDLQSTIYEGMFGDDIFPAMSMDVICAFQVFDHLRKPIEFLKVCRKYLKRDGRLMMIMHDRSHWITRFLRDHSPIVDIEHPILYNKASLMKLLENQGFEVIDCFAVTNRYLVSYWLKLIPMPAFLKEFLMRWIRRNASRWSMALRVGNMGIVARKKNE